MLAINPPATAPRKLAPNCLPCAINHNGPVPAPERYWKPSVDSDSADGDKHPTSYFRGRKLRGRVVKVPEGYQGVVLEKGKEDGGAAQDGKRTAGVKRPVQDEEEDEDEDMDGAEPVETNTLEQKAAFEEIVVWGHEVVPEEDDVYVKGVEEWMKIAEAVSFPTAWNYCQSRLTERQMHFDRDSAGE